MQGGEQRGAEEQARRHAAAAAAEAELAEYHAGSKPPATSAARATGRRGRSIRRSAPVRRAAPGRVYRRLARDRRSPSTGRPAPPRSATTARRACAGVGGARRVGARGDRRGWLRQQRPEHAGARPCRPSPTSRARSPAIAASRRGRTPGPGRRPGCAPRRPARGRRCADGAATRAGPATARRAGRRRSPRCRTARPVAPANASSSRIADQRVGGLVRVRPGRGALGLARAPACDAHDGMTADERDVHGHLLVAGARHRRARRRRATAVDRPPAPRRATSPTTSGTPAWRCPPSRARSPPGWCPGGARDRSRCW